MIWQVRALLQAHGYRYVMRQRGNDIWIDPKTAWAAAGARRARVAARKGEMQSCMLDKNCLNYALV